MEKAMDEMTGKLDKIKKYFDENTDATRDDLNRKTKQELIEYIASSEWYNRLSTSSNKMYKAFAVKGVPGMATSNNEDVDKMMEVVSAECAVSHFERVDDVLRFTAQHECTHDVAQKIASQLIKKLKVFLTEEMKLSKEQLRGLVITPHSKESRKDLTKHDENEEMQSFFD